MQARVWRWATRAARARSPEFMAPGRGAERRIIRLDNPGVPERTAGHTISVAVQYLLPGEVAPAHRHTPNAIRFMLHGEGAFTTIEGDKFVMRRGDLVVTPSMTWHDHGNEGHEPVMWTDALDSRGALPRNLAMDRTRASSNRCARARPPATCTFPRDGVLRSPRSRAGAAIPRRRDMEYRDPATAGRGPALGCYPQMLRRACARARTARRRAPSITWCRARASRKSMDAPSVGRGRFLRGPPGRFTATATKAPRRLLDSVAGVRCCGALRPLSYGGVEPLSTACSRRRSPERLQLESVAGVVHCGQLERREPSIRRGSRCGRPPCCAAPGSTSYRRTRLGSS